MIGEHQAKNEGFEAQSQNTPRNKNPYIALAKQWDAGWLEREVMELRHKLEEDKIKNLGTLFIGWKKSML